MWSTPVNADWTAIDTAFGGSTLLNSTGLSGNQTLSSTQYRPLSLLVSGTPTAAVNYVVPSGVGGQWVFQNLTSGGFTVSIQSATGGAAIPCPAGSSTLVSCDGSASGMRLSISTPPPAAGSNTQVQFNNGGVLGGSAALIWDGTTLFSTGLNIGGNVFLGVNSGSTITIEGTAIAAPNNLNIGTNALFLNTTTKQMGVGTTAVGANSITTNGTIQSLSGGFVFPDNTVQTTAAAGTSPGAPASSVQFNDAGVFGGLAGFVFNKGSGVLTVPGLNVTGAATITGALSAGSILTGATGTIALFAGATIPGGMNAVFANGQAISRTTFAALFAMVGTTYGVGDGTTTFNVPDLRGRVPAGVDAMGGASAAGRLGSGATGGITGTASLAASGGEQSHVQTLAELAAHTHTSVVPGSTTPSTGGGAVIGVGAGNTGSSGTSAAANVVQPTLVLNFIIFT